jgi:hypothetical protein
LKDQLEEAEEQTSLVTKELREKSRDFELLKRQHADAQRAVQLLQVGGRRQFLNGFCAPMYTQEKVRACTTLGLFQLAPSPPLKTHHRGLLKTDFHACEKNKGLVPVALPIYA